ncbi:uncharacterized protein LOC116195095 [Punica granatum]|uniref:DUF7722 domain-containing protein n=2 Tax=Punica granatum TaxID=22663 RepID=A0A218WB51_PUNGR|nr:uncharacterized protein LOC116195095 [Punica granatum]OWM70025.1 hypothetical protein CDL15_Pgr025874 [Punica granatum]PKI72333.1 hypothetical protein CRG98_007203 [Punica granatum]
MEGSKEDTGGGIGFFQMPLHYPRYTRQDYQAMPEWKLDHLLAQYGLPTNLSTLDYKREFAMGAFLWQSSPDQGRYSPSSSSIDCSGLADSSLLQKIK